MIEQCELPRHLLWKGLVMVEPAGQILYGNVFVGQYRPGSHEGFGACVVLAFLYVP